MRETSKARLLVVLGRLPVVLLVVVGLNQLRLARTDHLSPWSGGGFGMFASDDSPGSRHLHVFLDSPGVRREVVFPRSYDTMLRKALVLPSSSRLQQVAADALNQHADSFIGWEEVVVEVWRNDYEPQTLQPLARLIRRERVSVDSR